MRTQTRNPGRTSRPPAYPPATGSGIATPEAGAVRDLDLFELARRGDRAAYAGLYLVHGAMVHAILLARVGRAEADDLTQEVFISAWRRLAEVRDGEALAGWLAAIARTKALDALRSGARRRTHESNAARPEGASAPDRADCPDAAVRAEAVLDAIRELPEAYREPLLLRLLAGLTGPQIARCLGMTHGSVRVNLHRGMAMLRAALPEGSR